MLTLQEIVPSGGATPRNFALSPSGRHLLVANQNGDAIVIFRRDEKTGALTDSGKRIEIGHPRLREALYPVTDEKHSPRKGRRKGGGVTMADVAAGCGRLHADGFAGVAFSPTP